MFLDKPSFLKRIRRSIVARINIQFRKYTISFGSINPESRIFLRFRLGAQPGVSYSFYDSVREHQPGVSYLPTIPFGSINPESRIRPMIPFGSINPESRIFLRFRSGASTRSLASSYDSVRKHLPECRIFLRFRSGASTRSLVSFYDSIREHQPEVSYLPTIPFKSINPKSRIFLMIPFEKCANL